MGRKKQYKVKHKQKTKRHARVKKLRDKGVDLKEYYYDGKYIGPRSGK